MLEILKQEKVDFFQKKIYGVVGTQNEIKFPFGTVLPWTDHRENYDNLAVKMFIHENYEQLQIATEKIVQRYRSDAHKRRFVSLLKFLKVILLLVLILGAVWGVSIIYTQARIYKIE